MNFKKLENNLLDMIQEQQVKIGYMSGVTRFYYPLQSLNRLLGTELTEEEMQHGLDILKQHDNKVDYLLTHSPSTSELILMGGKGLYESDILTDYLEKVKAECDYKKHFFGHMHVNRAINEKDICLYEQIIRIN